MVNIVLIVLNVAASLFLIVTILLHSGRGSGMSDLFGGGASLSGGTALERTLDRVTVVTAVIWGVSVFLLDLWWKP